jgi:hypothetical protein
VQQTDTGNARNGNNSGIADKFFPVDGRIRYSVVRFHILLVVSFGVYKIMKCRDFCLKEGWERGSKAFPESRVISANVVKILYLFVQPDE